MTQIQVDKLVDAIKGSLISSGGFSLRDWFAGQALAGLLSGLPNDVYPEGCGPHSEGDEIPKGWAKLSYEYADAMLAAREKQ